MALADRRSTPLLIPPDLGVLPFSASANTVFISCGGIPCVRPFLYSLTQKNLLQAYAQTRLAIVSIWSGSGLFCN